MGMVRADDPQLTRPSVRYSRDPTPATSARRSTLALICSISPGPIGLPETTSVLTVVPVADEVRDSYNQ